MEFLYFLLAGVLGGVLAGMGMGGGTLTIPLLVLALGVGQLTAQFVNLIAFLPSGSVALGLHVKNKLVDTKNLLYI
ncbi:MAG: sulfite exporter TauE/SafE family protein, partial [Clostridia bacterium]